MSNFKPIVPNLTDPELIGVEETKAVQPKSNAVSNMTIVVSSVVLTVIVILLIWQAYKMFTDTEEKPEVHPVRDNRQYYGMRNPEDRRQYYRGDPRGDPRIASKDDRPSLDDAAMNYKTRPILKSGTRITDRVVEVTDEATEEPGNVELTELSEVVVDDPPDEEGWKGELLKELSEDAKNVSFLEPEQSCNFVAKTGKNKGKACGAAVVGNGKCKAHNK